MSIEQLLFLLLLIGIPLLERLSRALRARTNDSAAERAPTVGEPNVPRSRPPATHGAGGTTSEGRRRELPLPVSPIPPAVPQAVRHTAPELLLASGRKPRVRREDERGPAARLRAGHSDRPARSGTVPRRVIAGGDLRRAIVLIAILGPCRALEPKDASPLG